MITAGRLRHQITVQRLQVTPNEFGEPEQAWVDLAVVRADVLPISGREYFAAQKTNAEGLVSIVIRYVAGLAITERDRVSYAGRVYDINAVINVEQRNRRLELKCSVNTDGA